MPENSLFQAATCEDALATNTGADVPCTYDCDILRAEYFPGRSAWTETDTGGVRCFLYEVQQRRWRAEAGPDLLELKQTRFDWFSHLEPQVLASAGSVSFQIGEGAVCTNVTIVTETIGDLSEMQDNIAGTRANVTRCLPSGIHQHVHTVEGTHTVSVVGYNESRIEHNGAGGLTDFVIGDCTDVLIRVVTTASAGTITLMLTAVSMPLNRESWQLTVPPGNGLHELELCMFDNDYTLLASSSGWQGTVSVVSIADDSTIYVPEDEDWIIQGTIVDGLPVELDSRLSSGSGNGEDSTVAPGVRGCRWGRPSSANLVFRHFRITGQVAPLDKYQSCRVFSLRKYEGDPASRHGGAFKYEGGAAPVRLILEGLVFDRE
eukprot:SAG31_NODE_724_length_12555_cov_11.624277_13_plen_376_part_00